MSPYDLIIDEIREDSVLDLIVSLQRALGRCPRKRRNILSTIEFVRHLNEELADKGLSSGASVLLEALPLACRLVAHARSDDIMQEPFPDEEHLITPRTIKKEIIKNLIEEGELTKERAEQIMKEQEEWKREDKEWEDDIL